MSVSYNNISGFNYQFLQKKKYYNLLTKSKLSKNEEIQNNCKNCFQRKSQNEFIKKRKSIIIKNKNEDDEKNQFYYPNFSLLKNINETRMKNISKLVSIDQIKSHTSFNIPNNIEIDNIEEEKKFSFHLSSKKELNNSKFQELFIAKNNNNYITNNAQILDGESKKSFCLLKTKVKSK